MRRYKKLSFIVLMITIGSLLFVVVRNRIMDSTIEDRYIIGPSGYAEFKAAGSTFVEKYEIFLNTDLAVLEEASIIRAEKLPDETVKTYSENLQGLIESLRIARAEVPELRDLPFRTGGDLLNVYNKLWVRVGLIPRNNKKLSEINKIAMFLHLNLDAVKLTENPFIQCSFFAEGFFEKFDKNILKGQAYIVIRSIMSFDYGRSMLVNLINPNIYPSIYSKKSCNFLFLDLKTFAAPRGDPRLHVLSRFITTPYTYEKFTDYTCDEFAEIFLLDSQGNIYRIVPHLEKLYLLNNKKEKELNYKTYIDKINFRGFSDKELYAFFNERKLIF